MAPEKFLARNSCEAVDKLINECKKTEPCIDILRRFQKGPNGTQEGEEWQNEDDCDLQWVKDCPNMMKLSNALAKSWGKSGSESGTAIFHIIFNETITSELQILENDQEDNDDIDNENDSEGSGDSDNDMASGSSGDSSTKTFVFSDFCNQYYGDDEGLSDVEVDVGLLLLTLYDLHSHAMPSYGTMLLYFNRLKLDNPENQQHNDNRHNILRSLTNSVFGKSGKNLSIVDVLLISKFPAQDITEILDYAEVGPRHTFGEERFVPSTNCEFIGQEGSFYGNKSEQSLTSGMRLPCSGDDNDEEDCCELIGSVSNSSNIKSLLTVMKYSGNSVSRTHQIESGEMKELWTYMQNRYNLRTEGKLETKIPTPMCSFGRDLLSDCKILKPVPSERGICYSYNSLDTKEMFQPTQYVADFDSVFGSWSNSSGSVLDNPGGHGPSKGFQVLMDRGDGFLESEVQSKELLSDFFSAAIHSPNSTADQLNSGIRLNSGFTTTIRLEVTQLISASDLRSMSIEERNCHFTDETGGLDLFKIYTQANCLSECKSRAAAESCGCVPWSAARSNEMGTRKICDYFGNECYKRSIEDLDTSDCECPNDCAAEKYSLSIVVKALDKEGICKKPSELKDYIYRDFERRPFLHWMVNIRSDEPKTDFEDNQREYCNR